MKKKTYPGSLFHMPDPPANRQLDKMLPTHDPWRLVVELYVGYGQTQPAIAAMLGYHVTWVNQVLRTWQRHYQLPYWPGYYHGYALRMNSIYEAQDLTDDHKARAAAFLAESGRIPDPPRRSQNPRSRQLYGGGATEASLHARARMRVVKEWREKEKLTFIEIAKRLGVSDGRPRQIYVRACRLAKKGHLDEPSPFVPLGPKPSIPLDRAQAFMATIAALVELTDHA